ncbi:hypothetical protein [Mycoplasma elephantis]|uniref:hypothetical protein n=1 Tax=Mycoplasma elephantis TaxID=114882 RepID=UPI00048229C5|nr:hypothetical protein [Mycoplasma elephantis]
MDHKIKEIVEKVLETTPGVYGLTKLDYTNNAFEIVDRNSWHKYIYLSEHNNIFAVKISIVIKDNVSSKNIAQSLTKTIVFLANKQNIQIKEILIFIRGVIYE